ncbi:hypothetical protein L2E82_06178 [Cichorium intybus]|uniref:Uncharacterized protein n=1 Tax=Cichorium intybus TaxID=13427 RepID=A0ACB9HAE5_CICIN|nr:hypothetical protein L2E82_06178 [Cichorium intybus]
MQSVQLKCACVNVSLAYFENTDRLCCRSNEASASVKEAGKCKYTTVAVHWGSRLELLTASERGWTL